MAGSFQSDLVQRFAFRDQVPQLHIAKRIDLEAGRAKFFHRLAALLHPNLVFRVRQSPFDAGIANDEFHLPAQRDVTVFQVAAIEEQGVVSAAQRRDELVHNPAGHAHKFVLRPACQLDRLDGLQAQLHEALPENRGAHLHRRRRAESGLPRNVAAKHQVRAGKPVTIGFQKLGDAPKVVAPGVRRVLLNRIETELRRIVEVKRPDANRAIAARAPRKPDIAIDGRRQHKPVVVVSVLANQVDAARRADHHLGSGSESLLEGCLNHEERLKGNG